MTKRERSAIFEWIRVYSIDKINHRSVLASWRFAAETLFCCQGLITVSIKKHVTDLPRIYVYN